MISVEYCQLMARYNSWQNQSLTAAADGLNDTARWADRGAFFKSIAATFNHLYWADALMLERIKGNPRPQDKISHSLTSPSNWSEFKTLRAVRDEEISQWAAGLVDTDLAGTIGWYPLGRSARVEMLRSIKVAQLFNHQTHHRGQIHAMLTAAGTMPGPTDFSALPKQEDPLKRSPADRGASLGGT